MKSIEVFKMSKKKKDPTFAELLNKFYYFLKDKLNFDDIEALTLIMTLLTLPIFIVFGFTHMQINSFRIAFFVTITIDIIVIIYSIVKFKYFKNKRVLFIEKLEDKTIEVKDVEDLKKLNHVEFEHFVKEMFTIKGYKAWVTQRTHDYGADIIAEKNKIRVAIQVKFSSRRVGGYAVYQAINGKRNYKAEKAILVTNNDFYNSAKLSAIQDDVKLISEHDISKFLRENGTIKLDYKKET